jgi:ribonuclease HI
MAKINVDASVGKKSIRGAVAAVARNKLGEFLGASATIFKGRTDAETLEALACREAVELARDLNLHRIRVATDCPNVVRSLEEQSLGRYAHVI